MDSTGKRRALAVSIAEMAQLLKTPVDEVVAGKIFTSRLEIVLKTTFPVQQKVKNQSTTTGCELCSDRFAIVCQKSDLTRLIETEPGPTTNQVLTGKQPRLRLPNRHTASGTGKILISIRQENERIAGMDVFSQQSDTQNLIVGSLRKLISPAFFRTDTYSSMAPP